VNTLLLSRLRVACLAVFALVVSAVLAAGCATGSYVSDAQLERAKQERRAKYQSEEREKRRIKREHREARSWAGWIDEQVPPEGPAVLRRGDLVLGAAIARADYAGASATRLTHLRMTAAARNAVAEGNTERALDLLERAIAVDGGEGFAYLYLGHIYTRRGDLERASGFLQQARRLLPPDPALQDEVQWLTDMASGGAQAGMPR